MIETNYYNFKMKKLFKYFISFLILAYIFMPILLFNNDNLREVNLILCIICVPCSFIYLELTNETYACYYMFLFTNIIVENVMISLIGLQFPMLPFVGMFVLRTSFIFLVYIRNKKLNSFVFKHRAILFLIFIGVAIVLPLGEYKLEMLLNFPINIYNIVDASLIMASYVLLVKLVIDVYKRKSFIETVYVGTILIIGLKLLLVITGVVKITGTLPGDSLFFFVGYWLLLIGLYIEVSSLITENKKLNQDVESMLEMDKLRSNFFANLSHEFKTPITIIMSCIQMMDFHTKNDDKNLAKHYLKYNKMLKQNAYRLTRLVNNIIDATKINVGFFTLKFHNTDIVKLINNIVTSVVPYARNRNINLSFSSTVKDLTIKCDFDSIERIMLNLLSNSIKFSNEEDAKILVSLDVDEDYVTIKVSDNGIGIPEDKIPIIFDAFVQGDKSLTRKHEGSGIGLSLTRLLVELHEGNIWIDKTSEKGTVFAFKLPNTLINEKPIDSFKDCDEVNSKMDIEFSDIYDLN